jgi:hypothetical protein
MKSKIKCSYPKCNKDAEVNLGMADPDAEQIPYCKECAEKVRMNTYMKIFDKRSQLNKTGGKKQNKV